jgi:hypothetical protein
METIKWLLTKAVENDFKISISKTKKADTIALTIEKKLSKRTISETVEFDLPLLARIEAVSLGSVVGAAVNKILQAEKENP